MMFAVAVALGCDVFDSASYALFARNGRYMTAQGTAKIDEIEYFPCNCPSCHGKGPEEVRKLLPMDRERFLASHNLHTCQSELQTVKQAVVDGRLWELLETRSRNHPALHRAFQRVLHYAKNLERETPVRKRKGPFVTTVESLSRPEVLRHQDRLLERYEVPSRAKVVLLLPESYLKPFRESLGKSRSLAKIEQRSDLHICSYGLAFAVVPYELLDVYPLSQTEDALSSTATTVRHASKRIEGYLKAATYKSCIIVVDEPWQSRIAKTLRSKFRGRTKVTILDARDLDTELHKHVLKALTRKNRH